MCDKTRNINLTNHLLFISIRQIFDHIFDSENKVFSKKKSEFSGISWNSANFQTLKMSWNSWNLKSHRNVNKFLSDYVLFNWIQQIFTHLMNIQKQVQKTRKHVQNKKFLQEIRNCCACLSFDIDLQWIENEVTTPLYRAPRPRMRGVRLWDGDKMSSPFPRMSSPFPRMSSPFPRMSSPFPNDISPPSPPNLFSCRRIRLRRRRRKNRRISTWGVSNFEISGLKYFHLWVSKIIENLNYIKNYERYEDEPEK